MPYETSDFSFDEGVQGRYLLWSFPDALEFYPANPDNMWRLLKYATVAFMKTSAVSISEFTLEIVRAPLAPTAHQIWLRRFDVGMNTTSPADLEANELYALNSTFIMPSQQLIGAGLLMPPRSQLRTLQTAGVPGTDATARMFILESASIDKLKPYI